MKNIKSVKIDLEIKNKLYLELVNLAKKYNVCLEELVKAYLKELCQKEEK